MSDRLVLNGVSLISTMVLVGGTLYFLAVL